MIRKGQLVCDLSSKHIAVVLEISITIRRVKILDLSTFRVCSINRNKLIPYDPDGGGFGGGSTHPLPVFSNKDIDDLAILIEINGGSLDTDNIRYYQREQQVIYEKVIRLRESQTQPVSVNEKVRIRS